MWRNRWLLMAHGRIEPLKARASDLIRPAEMDMGCTAHVFLRPKRGAPLEDLGAIFVDPDPKRSVIVRFRYRGHPVQGIVTLIDPHNWEKRSDVFPQVHVHLSETTQSQRKAPPGGAKNSAGREGFPQVGCLALPLWQVCT